MIISRRHSCSMTSGREDAYVAVILYDTICLSTYTLHYVTIERESVHALPVRMSQMVPAPSQLPLPPLPW